MAWTAGSVSVSRCRRYETVGVGQHLLSQLSRSKDGVVSRDATQDDTKLQEIKMLLYTDHSILSEPKLHLSVHQL